MAATKKTTTKKTTAKSAAKKSPVKRTRKAVEESVEDISEASQKDFQSIVSRVRGGFSDAAAALAESGGKLDETRRDVMLAIIENAQENADLTFDALREVMESDTMGDSLRIQRDALRESIERNLAQVREVTSLAAQGGKESIEPVTAYIDQLRSKDARAKA